MSGPGRMRTMLAELDERAASTPESRDRAVDFFRVAAIGVVVVWHWALSVTHRDDGTLTNPNPVEDVPGGWLLTWVFQVMPLFFIIGGFANLTGWDSVRNRTTPAENRRPLGAAARLFLRKRLSRLLLPTLLFVVVWVVADVAAWLMLDDYDGALAVMPIVFTPLWFLGAYVGVTMLVPVTATLHRRHGPVVAVLLGVAVAAVDLGRFGVDQGWLGALNTALVWLFVHQLGYLWRDGALDAVWRRWACLAGGLLLLVFSTRLDVYPLSMVAIPSEHISHMLPTTAVIGALAVAQLGAATLSAPSLNRWLRRPVPWRVVIGAGGVLLTVFLWHMTAFLLVFLAVEAAGFAPEPEPTAEWWAWRPFWLIAPAAVMVVLLAVFAPVEQRLRRALSLTDG
ncbi:acyltransferase family protein [Phytoactinopolyspora halotolerans]|uniref:Acyltransferase family protein n=1 Tax=Phytoactinopolyspora halotolerans TaxID=1981512 RepID=A0A6L9S1U0_9ACTN|nr:acyltransferase family protein [Phytoactinopolyspora halotolerans]NED98948.1 acyltransferase family protein [Phytoactinopolyspora halotolerans]